MVPFAGAVCRGPLGRAGRGLVAGWALVVLAFVRICFTSARTGNGRLFRGRFGIGTSECPEPVKYRSRKAVHQLLK